MSPRPAFSIGSERAGAMRIVAVGGDVDIASAPEFEDALAHALDDDAAAGVVVDLTRVTFIDSTGLSALVRAFERYRWSGRELALVSDERRVAIMLEVSRLDRVLKRYPTRGEALSAIAGPP
jgi:anti-anti-sigma factor